jgi:hypothetical protein
MNMNGKHLFICNDMKKIIFVLVSFLILAIKAGASSVDTMFYGAFGKITILFFLFLAMVDGIKEFLTWQKILLRRAHW